MKHFQSPLLTMLGCSARKRTLAELAGLGTGSWLVKVANFHLLGGKTDLAALWRENGVLLSACVTPLEIIDVVHAPSALIVSLFTRACTPAS